VGCFGVRTEGEEKEPRHGGALLREGGARQGRGGGIRRWTPRGGQEWGREKGARAWCGTAQVVQQRPAAARPQRARAAGRGHVARLVEQGRGRRG
jgi:hypothetical protein